MSKPYGGDYGNASWSNLSNGGSSDPAFPESSVNEYHYLIPSERTKKKKRKVAVTQERGPSQAASALNPQNFRGPSYLDWLDVIWINGWWMPLAEMPKAGTKLEVDKKKGHGQDYATVIGKGYEAKTTEITLALFMDTFSMTDYFYVYFTHIHEMLMPTKLDDRAAVNIYHPLLYDEGITQLVITERDTPTHVGKQILHVKIAGYDTRYKFAANRKTGVKQMKPKKGPQAEVSGQTSIPHVSASKSTNGNGPASVQSGQP